MRATPPPPHQALMLHLGFSESMSLSKSSSLKSISCLSNANVAHTDKNTQEHRSAAFQVWGLESPVIAHLSCATLRWCILFPCQIVCIYHHLAQNTSVSCLPQVHYFIATSLLPLFYYYHIISLMGDVSMVMQKPYHSEPIKSTLAYKLGNSLEGTWFLNSHFMFLWEKTYWSQWPWTLTACVGGEKVSVSAWVF